MKNDLIFKWPTKRNGDPADTVMFPNLGLRLCEDCWNQIHPTGGCRIPRCQCGCYQGRNKGLSKPHIPHKDCEENQSFPDAGTIEIK